MFEIGDLIIYGNTGVCRVVHIGKPELAGVHDGRDYYTLSPYYAEKSVIFTPCDNDRVIMRPVISRDEADELIREITSVELLTISDEKKREECYKEAIRSCIPQKCVSVIKTIYVRKQQRIAEGKKATASDEKYFQMAEEKLYGELAVVLELEMNKVRDYILGCVEG
ncbi:MAG: CarD family transcriptional regulator [Parasporobacterium sp.]|nr:CarD family transcriptional regulator [Parasporobacterium sp.]